MWTRNPVDFIDLGDVPADTAPEGEFGAGAVQRVLSRDATDGAQTGVLILREPQRGYLSCGLDAYVLSGSGFVNGQPIRQNYFLHAHGPTEIELEPLAGPLVLYFGPYGRPEFPQSSVPGQPRSELQVTDVESIPWTPAKWSGDHPLLPGVALKQLVDTGTMFVYVSGMLPGWRSELEESHPVFEESFKLSGDILMGRRGVMGSGSYFYRHPDVFHGPLYTRTGTTSLIRSNAATTTSYREPEPGFGWRRLADAAYSGQV